MDGNFVASSSSILMSPAGKINAPVKFIGAVEDEWQLYSGNPSDYTLGRPIGYGASSTVYEAEYHSPTESIPCALKVSDLDSMPVNSLRLLYRETQLMSLSKHPNVLRVRGTWMQGYKLYIALRLMRSGSVADVMHYGWPRGVDEEVARCVLKQALEGLNYLHINGFIHRDVKAANLLVDDDGTVLLGDLGVAASLHEEDSISANYTAVSNSDIITRPSTVPGRTSFGKRKSFVGTPCWMAPEVISQKHYDAKADIWSLGITALELAEGKAPGSREPPQKILMKTIQDDPPTLNREGGQFKYSKAFKEIIESCLVKDPSKRPTTEELLEMPFFKGAKKKGYLVGALLSGLPPLVDRLEHRRSTSMRTHLTMSSWDFSNTSPVISTTSTSVPLQRIFRRDDELFEMEEVREPPDSTREKEHTEARTLSTDSLQDTRRREGTHFPPSLIEDGVSIPPTSPPLSFVTSSIRSVHPQPNLSSNQSSTLSLRSDNFIQQPAVTPSGSWWKLRSRRPKSSGNEKSLPSAPSKIVPAPVADKGKSSGDGMGSLLSKRSTTRPSR